MTYHCERCGQTALDTDTICWHCGQSLPQRGLKQATSPPVEDDPTKRPLISLVIYGGLTLAIFVALLIVMQTLGRQPQLVQGLSTTRPPGWSVVTDENRLFTLNLPPGWVWLDRYDSLQEAEFIEQVRRNSQYQAVLAPYDELADDRQLLFLGTIDSLKEKANESPFVVVTSSQIIGRFSPEQMAVYLRRRPAGVEMSRFDLVGSFDDSQRAIYFLTLPDGGQKLRCQHLFYNGMPNSYLVAGCAAEDNYIDYTGAIHNILVSFQPLGNP